MNLFRSLLIAGLLLAHPCANATSFDCQRGRSPTERMICGDPALSTLDDTLGQLYWKARRRVTARRAFIDDSDSKWAWREANCREAWPRRERAMCERDRAVRQAVGVSAA